MRKRLSVSDHLQAIQAAMPTDGSTISHADLVQALENSDQGESAKYLREAKNRGVIVGNVTHQEGAKPALLYRLPEQGLTGESE